MFWKVLLLLLTHFNTYQTKIYYKCLVFYGVGLSIRLSNTRGGDTEMARRALNFRGDLNVNKEENQIVLRALYKLHLIKLLCLAQ